MQLELLSKKPQDLVNERHHRSAAMYNMLHGTKTTAIILKCQVWFATRCCTLSAAASWSGGLTNAAYKRAATSRSGKLWRSSTTSYASRLQQQRQGVTFGFDDKTNTSFFYFCNLVFAQFKLLFQRQILCRVFPIIVKLQAYL